MLSHLEANDEYLRFWPEVGPNGEVAEPTILVRWELTEAGIQALAEAHAVEPRLLLVVEEDRGWEGQRMVMPLADRQRYIALHRSGITTILACVVWTDDPEEVPVEELLLKKRGGSFSRVYDVLRHDRRLYDQLDEQADEYAYLLEQDNLDPEVATAIQNQLDGLHQQMERLEEAGFESRLHPDMFEHVPDSYGAHQLGEVKFAVNLPAKAFGQNTRLTKWLATRIWQDPARDQCHQRRRAILTVIASPFLALLLVLILVCLLCRSVIAVGIIGVLHLFGMRGINYRPLNPLARESPDDIWYALSPSRWWTRRVVKSDGRVVYEPRSALTYIFNPVAAVLILIMLSGVNGTYSTDGYASYVLAVIVTVAWVAAIYMAYFYLFPASNQPTIVTELSEAELADRLAHPKQSKMLVIQLNLQKTKAKVCKPLAR